MTFEQIVRVESSETDGDESGREWTVHYVLFRSQDDDGRECFDLYDDDGSGNGSMICRGHNKTRMVSLALRLGEFIEWRAPVHIEDDEPAPYAHPADGRPSFMGNC